ncbi:MAG: sigma-54-dependent Fis family transcriptional regulator [Candidatus Sulfobium sp.]
MEKSHRILVIDDEESIRYTFESFLEDEGYSVDTARDYHEAVGRIGDTDFDLIFADVILPGGKTGIDVIRELRARKQDCPVIMVTGDPNVESASDAVRLGAFDYIPKPVRQDTLLRVAAMALKHKTVTEEKERYRSNLEAIFRSVKDAIITVDRNTRVVELNAAAAKICGLSREDIGQPFSSVQADCRKNCLGALSETIDTGQPVEVSRLECGHRKSPGHVVTLSTSPLLDHQGGFSGVVIVVRDETRLADLERDLKERRQFHNIIGSDWKMQEIYSLIESLADVQTTVLITGESGTGKELVADALHYRGIRNDKPLVKVNCAALSENLLESELFGHVKGAFTGAITDKVGRFQKADGGTIFLDEIGDISPKMQVRLLRVLQEMEFERVGDSTPVRVDVRVIAATNQELAEKVRRSEFREDLYYRLKVIEMHLPPVRDRLEDIPLLTGHFLKKFNKKFNRDITGISTEVQRIFMDHPWPGNVRELEHTLEHAFILCRQNIITVEHLPGNIKGAAKTTMSGEARGKKDEAAEILRALEKAGGNKAKAARLLGIDRKTLYRKMEKHSLAGNT